MLECFVEEVAVAVAAAAAGLVAALVLELRETLEPLQLFLADSDLSRSISSVQQSQSRKRCS